MLHKSIGQAALWMGGWLACTLLMTVGGRELASELPVFVVMMLRSGFAVALLLPIVLWQGGRPLRTGRFGLHVWRNLVHYTAQYCWFYALALIPIARVVAIEFTLPIWTAILATLFLGERLSPSRLTAISLGFLGILIIVRPGIGGLGEGELTALYSAVAFAISMTMTKALTRTDSALTVIVYMFAVQTVIGALPAYAVWEWPSAELWPWVLTIGVAGTVSHYCLARAIASADATVVVPMDFLRVPLTALAGWFLYTERIDAWFALGVGLIMFGNLLNVRQEGAAAPAAGVRGMPVRRPGGDFPT